MKIFPFLVLFCYPYFIFLTISKRARFRPGEPTEWTNFQEAVSAMARDLPAVRKSNFPYPWHEDKLPRTQAAGASSSSSFHPGVAQQGTGAGSQSNSTNAADPCTDTPHCAGFDAKHRGKTAKKLLEYKFLYSAHGRCVQCMDYYARQAGLDVTCKSCNMNAREWAASSLGGRKRATVPIPDDVERWLKRHNL